jgi:hypothetical protein
MALVGRPSMCAALAGPALILSAAAATAASVRIRLIASSLFEIGQRQRFLAAVAKLFDGEGDRLGGDASDAHAA